MALYRRLDKAWARGEALLTVVLLIAMVSIASFSAGIRNLTHFEVQWATRLLSELDWTDSFLHKATLLLAFLGASQATYYRKHIGIDLLTRLAPLKPKYLMHGVSGLISGVGALAIAISFASAVALNLRERPLEYEVLGEGRAVHVCDAAPEQLQPLLGVTRPRLFCGLRALLDMVGIPAETPGATFQIVVPFIFVIISVRLFSAGVVSLSAVARGEAAMNALEAEENARIAAVHASLDRDPSQPTELS